ncbi:MAG TPA: hypothetical protein VNJ01_08155 [Bacteriovoracaceae bacterium]|nr:hypothetical protein [Bacteriovoracaceae bacterium]
MRRRHVFILTAICIIGFAIVFLFNEDNGPTQPMEPVQMKAAPQVESSTTPGLSVPRPEPLMLKQKASRALARSYPATKKADRTLANDFEYIELGSYPLSIVRNHVAYPSKDTTGTRHFIRGYEIQESNSPGDFNLIFNKETKRYGVWSREIVLRGSETVLTQVQERFNLSKVSEGHQPFAIYQVPSDISFESIHSALTKTASVSFEFDVIYSKKRLQ